MIGLEISGRSYDPLTYEISSNPVQGRIIDIGKASIKIWINGSSTPSYFSVDVAYCSPFINGSYSTESVIRIPVYLFTSIQSAPVDTSKYSYVYGKKNNFLDFTESREYYEGVVIFRSVCPVILYESSNKIYSEGNFLICYPIISSPEDYDENNLIFIEELKCIFLDPTYGQTTSNSLTESNTINREES